MIVGRDIEIESIRGLWRAALLGRGGSLTLVGDAGTGISSLLAAGRRLAEDDGAAVVPISGVEAEQSMAGAGVSQLVHRLRPWPAELPDSLVELLDGPATVPRGTAPTGSAPADTDTVAVGSALLTLLGEISRTSPVLVTVDDVHFLDRGSAMALSYISRRLGGRRIAVVAGGHDVGFCDLPDVHRIGPLAPEDAVRALRAAYGHRMLAARVTRRVVEASRGVPGLMHRTVEALSSAQRLGAAPLPEPLPTAPGNPSVGAAASTWGRIEGLDHGARRMLAALAVVAHGSDDTTALTTLLDVSGGTQSTLADLERAGLVSVDRSEVAFVRPSDRSPAYWSFPAPDRRDLHARWADIVDDDIARAVHRAAAGIGADPDLAADLEEIAHRATASGDHALAVECWTRARQLHSDPAERRRAGIAAARASITDGDMTAARALVAELPPPELDGLPRADHGAGSIDADLLGADLLGADLLGADLLGADLLGADLLGADLLGVHAALRENDGDVDGAVRLWTAAIEAAAPIDPDAAAGHTIDLCLALERHSGHSRVIDVIGSLEPVMAPLAPLVQCQLDILLGVSEIVTGRIDAASIQRVARYEELMALDDVAIVPHLPFITSAVAVSLAHFRQHDAARSVIDRCEQIATARGLSFVAPALATARCLSAVRSDLPGAAMYAAQAVAVADELGRPELSAIARGYLLSTQAQLGLESVLDEITRSESWPDPFVSIIRGVAASGYWLTMGDHEKALTAALATEVPAAATHVLHSRWLADLGEAAAHCGRHDLARDAIDRMRSLDGFDTDHWLIGTAERIEGMLAEFEHCSDHFAASVAAFEASTNTISVARSELLWGERLRRARRRGAARPHLERARALFTEVGAGRWTERAERELAAAGAVAGSRDHSRDAERVLTAQELQVARLAVAGASYRDIAARLFVSPRTVETHLSSVYRKLGVRNRAELSARAVDDPALRTST